MNRKDTERELALEYRQLTEESGVLALVYADAEKDEDFISGQPVDDSNREAIVGFLSSIASGLNLVNAVRGRKEAKLVIGKEIADSIMGQI